MHSGSADSFSQFCSLAQCIMLLSLKIGSNILKVWQKLDNLISLGLDYLEKKIILNAVSQLIQYLIIQHT